MKEDKTTRVLVRVIATIGIAVFTVLLFIVFLLRIKDENESIFSTDNLIEGILLFSFVVVGGLVLSLKCGNKPGDNE